jgi:DHA1 family multidrug resistance protein-like MFS transporter
MWIAALTLVILLVFLPETSSKNILYRRAQRLRKLTGNDRLKTEAEIAFQHVTVVKIAKMTIVRPWVLTFTEPLIFLLHMWVALIFGILFVWFESFPLVFIGIYGFNLGENGLAFVGLMIGGLASVPPFVWYCRAVQEKQFNEKGQIIKPELRLPPSMVAAFCLPLSLFWFGFTARSDIHWIVCIAGTAFFAIGTLLVVVS